MEEEKKEAEGFKATFKRLMTQKIKRPKNAGKILKNLLIAIILVLAALRFAANG